jgi:hypothetical protein
MFLNGPGAEISKCVARALAGLHAIDPATFRSNAKGRQTKAGSGNAGYVTVVFIQRGAIHAGAVRNQAGLRISFVPEIPKRALLEIFKE